MTTLRSTLFHLLARLFQRWANALEPVHTPVAEPRDSPDAWFDPAGPPPDHWLDAARVQPPQHWLDTVREHAPGLLEPDGDGVIDWAVDETALDALTPPRRGKKNENAEVVWDERPMAPPARPRERRTPVRERALPLHDVRASLPPAGQPVRNVVSRTGRAARLRVAGTPHPQPLRGLRLPAAPRFALRASGAKQPGEGISPRSVTTTQSNKPSRQNGKYAERWPTYSDFSGSPRPEGEGLGVRGSSPRPRVRQIRSTLADASARGQTAAPPLISVRGSTTSPAEVRVSSHHFPALLDDPRDPDGVDGREAERRRRLDAEQEGRSWNA